MLTGVQKVVRCLLLPSSMEYGSVLKEIHCPILPCTAQYCPALPNTARHCGNETSNAQCCGTVLRSTAHCSPEVWQCTEGDPLPIAPQQCGNVWREIHCRLLPNTMAV